MEQVKETFGEPTTDYSLSWDDAGRCSLYPAPREGFERSAPPRHKGPRVTERLSQNAVRTIRGAVMKAALLGCPLVVMWTFTVKEKDEGGKWECPREAVASGALVMSEELSRTFDALAKDRKRKGDKRPFHNVWAAENPPAGVENEVNGRGEVVEGTSNPHIHALLSWVFKAPQTKGPKAKRKAAAMAAFVEFAAYVEDLWGLGWVHMEFLDKPEAAGAYLLKAAGYVTKGAAKDQDPQPIRGQRWYVSDGIRPVRKSRPVELDPEAVRRLHALRFQAARDPIRFDDGRVAVRRYCINGYGLSSDDFLAAVLGHAGDYYFCPEFVPDAEALADADRQRANATPEARALRHRQVVRRFYEDQEWEASVKASGTAWVASSEVLAVWDLGGGPRWSSNEGDPFCPWGLDGVLLWERDPYEETPDPSSLVPV